MGSRGSSVTSCKRQPGSGRVQRSPHIRCRRVSLPPAVSQPGKRGRVVDVKQGASWTTPKEEEKRAHVPEHEAPALGDKSRHVDESYTQEKGEGALPVKVVVIPDTNSMYNETMNRNIYDLYEVGDLKGEEASLPFVHGVELAGPKGEVVRFRSVFDDGASVNAIDETLYQTLKGRLAALSPSEKILRMADGRRVPSASRRARPARRSCD